MSAFIWSARTLSAWSGGSLVTPGPPTCCLRMRAEGLWEARSHLGLCKGFSISLADSETPQVTASQSGLLLSPNLGAASPVKG